MLMQQLDGLAIPAPLLCMHDGHARQSVVHACMVMRVKAKINMMR